MTANPLFPVDQLLSFMEANQWQLTALAIIGSAMFSMWYFSIRNRRIRTMKSIFERTQLYVKIERGKRQTKVYPALVRFSQTSDEEYDVFEYEIKPGMAIHQFEEKKKYFEAAFNSKAIVNGKGSWLEIKIRKTPYKGVTSS